MTTAEIISAEIISDQGPSGTKMMSEMQPLEVCRVVDERYAYGHIVMRTASTRKFEVIDLSKLNINGCWEKSQVTILVEPWYGDILIKSRP